jgi:hypothetical protein
MLAVVAGLMLSGRSVARADDSCDSSEQVACIPLPSDNSGPQGGTSSASSTAAAAPNLAAVPIPCPSAGCCGSIPPGGPLIPDSPIAPAPNSCPPPNNYCFPYPPPVVGSANAAASAAVPVPGPAPYTCSPYRSIYTTINLGNAADVRALRTLSSDNLPQYWRQNALNQLQSQVSYLQSVGDYANARLYSIQVQNATLDLLSSTARVRTLEHWLYQERSGYDGSLVYNQDEWVTNNYTLSATGNVWYITGDTISTANGPIPPSGGG